jgi:Astacin (Peptidase family M12A)
MKILNVGLSLALTCTLISCGGQPAQEQATFVETPQAQPSQVGKIGTLAVDVTPTVIDVSQAMTGPTKTLNRIGSLSVTPTTQASINAITAQKMMTDPYVDLKFSDGSTFSYNNVAGVAVTNGDIGYSLSDQIPDMAASYNAYLKRKANTVSTQSTIGSRVPKCVFWLFGCWLEFRNVPNWPEGKIYYQIGSSVSNVNGNDSKIRTAVTNWNIDTHNIPQFIEGKNPNGPTITFVQLPNNLKDSLSGLSFVGFTFQKANPYIYIVDGFFNNGNITHEMGHAAGLNHEHQRCDRDSFLQLDLTWYQKYVNFINWNGLCVWGEDIGKFNFDSIMLYHNASVIPKFTAVSNSFTVYRGNPQNYKYSGADSSATGHLDQGDVEDGLRTLYGGRGPSPLPASGCGSLLPGETLFVNQYKESCDRSAKLIYQADGNLVLYRTKDNKPLWATSTFGPSIGRVTMQFDGNLVMYDVGAKPIWSSGTPIYSGAYLKIANEGNMTLEYSGPVWSTNTFSCGVLLPGESLTVNQYLDSCDKSVRLQYQADGNLVLYRVVDWKPIWATSTFGGNVGRATMQLDGNFVLYNASNVGIWDTITMNSPGAALSVQNNGNLLVFKNATAIWNTNLSK